MAALALLSLDDIVEHGIEAAHALNRRAKEKRDRRSSFRRASFAGAIQDEIDEIYALKSAFVDALVRAGKATVGVYSVSQAAGMECYYCGRSWRGDDPWCRSCHDDSGEEVFANRRWYLVTAGTRSWHQPGHSASAATRAAASAIEPHDPTQPQREIPECNLTIAAQMEAVRLATRRLLAEVAAKNCETLNVRQEMTT